MADSEVVLEVAVLVEEADSAEIEADLAEEEEASEALGKCTKRLALSAERNAKFLSSQRRVSRFFARRATRKRRDFNKRIL